MEPEYYYLDLNQNKDNLKMPSFIRTNTFIRYSEDFPNKEYEYNLLLHYSNFEDNNNFESKYHIYIEWLTISCANVGINSISTTCKIQLTSKSYLNANFSVFIPKGQSKTDSAIEIFANSKATFTNCIFKNAGCAAIIVRDHSTAIFDHCVFEDNNISCLLLNNSYAKFINCKFKNDNNSILITQNCFCDIINCKFLNLKGKAIFGNKSSKITLQNTCFNNCAKEAAAIANETKLYINGNVTIENSQHTALRAINNSKIKAQYLMINKTNGNAIILNKSNGYFFDCHFNETIHSTIVMNGPESKSIFRNCNFYDNLHYSIVVCQNGCKPIFEYCNFLNCSTNNISIDKLAHPIFNNCYFKKIGKSSNSIFDPFNYIFFNLKSAINANLDGKNNVFNICGIKKEHKNSFAQNKIETKNEIIDINCHSDNCYLYEEDEEEDVNDNAKNDIYQKFTENGIIKINLQNFRKGNLIKSELSYDIYEAYDRNNKIKKYAAKCYKLNPSQLPKNDKNAINFQNQIVNHSHLCHPAISKIKAYCSRNFNHIKNPVILTDCCEYVTLNNIIQKIIKKEKIKGWDETQKLKIIYGIASGMEYLHSKNIIHRDLNPSNIFVDKCFHPKIGGFDLSVKVDENGNAPLSEVVGTDLCIAPETWRGEGYSKESDVYSFSMITYILEMNEIPFQNQNEYQICNNVAMKNIRPHINNDVDGNLKELIVSCWSEDKNKRPQFSQICRKLRSNRNFCAKNVDKKCFLKYVQYIDKCCKSN